MPPTDEPPDLCVAPARLAARTSAGNGLLALAAALTASTLATPLAASTVSAAQPTATLAAPQPTAALAAPQPAAALAAAFKRPRRLSKLQDLSRRDARQIAEWCLPKSCVGLWVPNGRRRDERRVQLRRGRAGQRVLRRRHLCRKSVQRRRLLQRKRHNCAPGMLRVLWQPPTTTAALAAPLPTAALSS